MVGILQIITYLLCVYLIFKGVEIFQIAYVSDRKLTDSAVILGILAIVASVVIAIAFSYWITIAAESVSNSLQR